MTVPVLASYLLALTFAWAAVAKAVRASTWSAMLDGYGFTGATARAISIAVPAAELGIAVLLATGLRSIGAALALALLAAFSLAILRAVTTQGTRLPCGCFGDTKERDFRLMLLRNALLAALAAVILVGQRSRTTLLQDPTDGVPLVLTLAGGVVICWTLWQVVTSLRGRRHS